MLESLFSVYSFQHHGQGAIRLIAYYESDFRTMDSYTSSVTPERAQWISAYLESPTQMKQDTQQGEV